MTCHAWGYYYNTRLLISFCSSCLCPLTSFKIKIVCFVHVVNWIFLGLLIMLSSYALKTWESNVLRWRLSAFNQPCTYWWKDRLHFSSCQRKIFQNQRHRHTHWYYYDIVSRGLTRGWACWAEWDRVTTGSRAHYLGCQVLIYTLWLWQELKKCKCKMQIKIV